MELIDQLTKNLGVSEKQAQGGAGLLFKLAQEKMGASDFSKVSSAVPDVNKLMSAAPSGVGLLGKLFGKKASSPAHIHQPHGGNAPTAPALREFLRADQQIHGRMRLVDIMEQGPGELTFIGGEAARLAQFHQLGIVAHVDDAEGFILRTQP